MSQPGAMAFYTTVTPDDTSLNLILKTQTVSVANSPF